MKRTFKYRLRFRIFPTESTYARRGICYVIILLILISCNSKTFTTEEELWAYLKNEENGYVQYKTVNGYHFSLMYKPTDLLVKQELGNNANSQEVKKLREKYRQYLYFNLSMSKNNKELLSVAAKSKNEFGALVNQLAFNMDSKVHLFTQQKDTIALVDFVYPRMYGMSNSTEVLFVYRREETKLKKEYLNFTIEDLGLYTGEVKFKVPLNSLENEPNLKI